MKHLGIMTTYFLLLLMGACSHSRGASAPDPTIFAKDNPNPTQWRMDLATFESDPTTKQPVPSSKRDVTVVYQFQQGLRGLLWRRTMKIVKGDQSLAMFQEGTVTQLDDQKMTLNVEKSSCDDAQGFRVLPGNDTIYYQSSKGVLNLNTAPFPPPAKGFGDALGQIFAGIIVDAMRTMLEQAFTFGSARTFLTSGHGNFKYDQSVQISSEALGQIGCFGVFGHDFAVSQLRPTW